MEGVNFRSFTAGDYEEVCLWWEWWWKGEKGIEREILPSDKNCLILEYKGRPIYAGFLFMGLDAPMGYLTWIVSNPHYKVKNREELLKIFIKESEEKAREQGACFMFTVCSNSTLKKAHEELGWWLDDKWPSYEGFKYV